LPCQAIVVNDSWPFPDFADYIKGEESFSEEEKRNLLSALESGRSECLYRDILVLNIDGTDVRPCDLVSRHNELTKIIFTNQELVPKGFCEDCTNLQEVTFPDDWRLEVIGRSAFEGCSSLRTIRFPNSLRYICESSFSSSGLESIAFNEGLIGIGEEAFSYSNLKDVSLPKSLVYIGDEAFKFCEDLERIVIPSGVRNIGAKAFMGCMSLMSVVIPVNVKSIGRSAFFVREGVADDPSGLERKCEFYFKGAKPMTDVSDGKGIFGDEDTAKAFATVWFKKGAKGWVDGETWNGVVVHEKPESSSAPL